MLNDNEYIVGISVVIMKLKTILFYFFKQPTVHNFLLLLKSCTKRIVLLQNSSNKISFLISLHVFTKLIDHYTPPSDFILFLKISQSVFIMHIKKISFT